MDAYTLNYCWDTVRDQLLRNWPDLTEDELDNVDGNLDKLYGLMLEKCGQPKEELDRYLDALPEPVPVPKLTRQSA